MDIPKHLAKGKNGDYSSIFPDEKEKTKSGLLLNQLNQHHGREDRGNLL